MTTRALVRLLVIWVVPVSLVLPAPVSAQFLEITNPLYFNLTPSQVSPVTTYEWRTLAESDDPVDVRFILVSTAPHGGSYAQTLAYIRDPVASAPEWSPWTSYLPPDVGTSWTSPSMDYGAYVFAVQGRDALGMEEMIVEPRNARRIRIQLFETGPLLTVTGDMISPIVTTTTTTPLTEITVGAGTLVDFCWTADASAYGGVVTGYRYQWDMTDPDDEFQWETGFIPFPTPSVCSTPKAFLVGDHRFDVEVIDNTGHKSRVPILIHIVPAVPVEQTTWGRVKALYQAERSPQP